jgi:hypothetical protein
MGGSSAVQGGHFVDPYGTELRGFTRGPIARLPEPEEVWLAALGAALPFTATAAIVTLDDSDIARAPARRAENHFGTAYTCPLMTAGFSAKAPTRSAGAGGTFSSFSSSTEDTSSAAAVPPEIAARQARAQALAPMRDDDPVALESAIQALLAGSPLQRIHDRALDAVIFAPGTFRQVLPWAPHYVNEAARVLAPHGVLGIVAERRARLVGPQELHEDFEEFKQYLDEHCPSPGTAEEEEGFANVVLPYSSVKRRWLTSEYPVTSTGALAAYVRSWPQYLAMAAPRPVEGAVPGVVRHDPADPLFAFIQTTEAHLAHLGTSAQRALRLEVDFCVVLCDARPSNRPAMVRLGTK